MLAYTFSGVLLGNLRLLTLVTPGGWNTVGAVELLDVGAPGPKSPIVALLVALLLLLLLLLFPALLLPPLLPPLWLVLLLVLLLPAVPFA